MNGAVRAGGALRFLFDPRGRTSRKGLWLGVLLPFLVCGFVSNAFGPFGGVVVWALFAWPLVVSGPWRRLHDVGRKGVWTVFFWGWYALGLAFFLREYLPLRAEARSMDQLVTADLLSASALGGFSTLLIFFTIQFGWLYLIPGQRGPNAYGPDPLAPSRQE